MEAYITAYKQWFYEYRKTGNAYNEFCTRCTELWSAMLPISSQQYERIMQEIRKIEQAYNEENMILL